MKKAIFANAIFYWFLVIFISFLLMYNINILLRTYQFVALSPIVIQITLLALIFLRFKLVKIAIQIWAVIFLIISNTFVILGSLMQLSAGKFGYVKSIEFFSSLCFLAIGIVILIFTNRTILVPDDGEQK
jgi:hypothetical protein